MTLIFSLLIAGIIYGARAINRGYGCLTFDDGSQGSSRSNRSARILDIHSGAIAIDKRTPMPGKLNPPTDQDFFSNSGRYLAYTHSTENGITLFIKALDNVYETPHPIDTHVMMQPLWMPDSRHLVYLGQTTSQSFVLGAVDADGSHPHSILLPQSSDFESASPDGAYVIIKKNTGSALSNDFYSVPNLELITSIPGDITNETWLPKGHTFAYQRGTELAIVNLDKAKVTHFPAPSVGTVTNIGIAPDGGAAFVEYALDENSSRVDVLIADGRSFPGVVEFTNGDTEHTLPVWSSDGQTLTLLEQTTNLWNIILFHTADGHIDTVATKVFPYLGASPDHRSIAFWPNRLPAVPLEVAGLNGTHPFTLVSGPGIMQNPLWSPDGKIVVDVWVSSERYDSVLTWANADGSDLHDWRDDVESISDVRWLSDGNSLAYIAQRKDRGFSVESIDLLNGIPRQFADHLAEVVMRKPEDAPGLISFWWRNVDGNGGLDAYWPDGKLVYRFKIAEPVLTLEDAQITLSSDGRIGAIKLGPIRQNESLYLASLDGTWSRMIRSGLTVLGDPLWAPDGSAIAFAQIAGYQPVSLEVVTAEGIDVRHYDSQFSLNQGYTDDPYINLTWTRCD